METLKTLTLAIAVMLGAYLVIFLSYILIPVSVFLFVFYVIKTMQKLEDE